MDTNSVLSWLWGGGGSTPEAQPQPLNLGTAPPLSEYPTSQDAENARKAGFGYHTGLEPYVNNELANIIGEKLSVPVQSTEPMKQEQNVKGAKVKGTPAKQAAFKPTTYTDTFIPTPATVQLPDHKWATLDESYASHPHAASIVNMQDPANARLRGIMDNRYMQAALAANRIPLASIGFDPSRFNVDVVSPPANVGGLYDPQKDWGYSATNPQDALVHEPIHRGINMLKTADPALYGDIAAKTRQALSNLPNEEMIVRHLMTSQAGNPEVKAEQVYGAGSAGSKQHQDAEALFNSKFLGEGRQKQLNDLQELAIRYHKERNPRGPH